MKITKGLLLFGMLMVAVSACFNPPEFQNTPRIDINTNDIYFGVTPSPTTPDSIVVPIRFQDGDGNLGLETDVTKNPLHFSDPFHPNTYFLADDGDLTPVTTYTAYSNEN